MMTEGDIVGKFTRDAVGRFASNTLSQKGKQAKTLRAQKKALSGKSGKDRKNNLKTNTYGNRVTNKQQAASLAKFRRKANGGG